MIQFRVRNFFKILIPFGLTQVVAIFAAYKFLPQFTQIQPRGFEGFTISDFIMLIVFAVAFFVLAVRFKKAGSIFFKVFLTFLIFSGVQVIASIWLNASLAALAGLLFIMAFWFFHNIFMHNVVMILTLAGIGSILGLALLPQTIIIVLIIFSFYDIVAVYKTGHMIKLAQSMIESHAIFGFVIPQSTAGLKKHISQVQPGEQFMILGSGDVVFPLLLSASLIRTSLTQSLLVAAFSMAGLFLMHLLFINQKVRRPMAALPPIALMSILGYLIISFL